jgi:chromosome partitioning protein
MAKVIAVTNQKGGVGKTTTAVNISASLAYYKCQVLLIDLDPQGNATMGSGIDKHGLEYSINNALLEERSLEEILQPTPAGFDLAPSNRDLTFAEINLLQVNRREHRLLQVLAKVKGHYDFVIIDCPPSLSMLTVNALIASDSVIIPVQCEYYALEGLSALVETIETLKSKVNPKLQIEGLVRTMFDPRNRLANEVSTQLHKHFNQKVYRTIIPRNVRLAEAPSHGLPVLLYDRNSPGAQAYLHLADEILKRRAQDLKDLKEEANHGEKESTRS